MDSVPDRIEKQIHLRAPRRRVWQAISDSRQFGAWFGAEFDGPFEVGKRVRARIVPTKVDPAVAKLQEPHAGVTFEVSVEQLEPERLFAFRSRPTADAEASGDVTTLVVFELKDADGGTLLTVTESGFSKLPPEQRAAAFAGNEAGWEMQTKLVEKYLATHA